MRIEAIREVHAAQPFKPFVLRLSDGRSLSIDNPGTLAFMSDKRTIFVALPKDKWEFVDSMLVTSVSSSNGHTRSRRKSA